MLTVYFNGCLQTVSVKEEKTADPHGPAATKLIITLTNNKPAIKAVLLKQNLLTSASRRFIVPAPGRQHSSQKLQ